MKAQEDWLLRRQVKLEGGFNGRTNKLVDSCYSFWQGAALAMCEVIKNNGSDIFDMEQYLAYCDRSKPSSEQKFDSFDIVDLDEGKRVRSVEDTSGALPFNQNALQRYILHCAQNLEGGGMRDKPSKSRDFYHSCYALSGLSISQTCITTAKKNDMSLETSSSAIAADNEDLPHIELDWSGAQVKEIIFV
jgi:protein farnesyltransferase subunit beta